MREERVEKLKVATARNLRREEVQHVPELGGVVLIATRDASGVISLRGGDEYWWDGYPPIIHAREKGTAAKPPKPVFSGSFFEKDVAVRGLQGGA